MKQNQKTIAYFSMEFAVDSRIPNYAGGLGVLAADTLLAAADLEENIIGVSLLYHQDDDAHKAFNPSPFMKKLPETVNVEIENRSVKVSIWKMDLKGASGKIVPIIFLSSFLPGNPQWDRDLTKHLYASDRYTRLGQEAILGIGGVRALQTLGYQISCYHMNEGHSACLTLELLNQNKNNLEKVRQLCTFTTHTPIAAGHDYFEYPLAHKTLPKTIPANIQELATKESLGMTQLALSLSKRVNSVSRRHQQVCQLMFPSNRFENVTNAIYHPRWAGQTMSKLFDHYLKNWESDPSVFSAAIKKLPDAEMRSAKQREKREFIHWINSHRHFFPLGEMIKDDFFDEHTLTIGFARRFVPYKRPTLLFQHLDWLRDIGYRKLQLVFAGRCHPDDQYCNNLRGSIAHYARELRGQVEIALVPEYDLDIAKRMVTGCDLWLNNPLPPREASGTSGMKAALNGTLNLSILDGWWIEAFHDDPLSGWGFGETEDYTHDNRDQSDFKALMENLSDAIDCYYNRKKEWSKRMKHAIALMSFFNTHRLVNDYANKIWR